MNWTNRSKMCKFYTEVCRKSFESTEKGKFGNGSLSKVKIMQKQ